MNKFKKDEKIICIDNFGFSSELTLNREYIVDNCYLEYNIEHIRLIGDNSGINVLSSRFITLKEYRINLRKEKLKKISK